MKSQLTRWRSHCFQGCWKKLPMKWGYKKIFPGMRDASFCKKFILKKKKTFWNWQPSKWWSDRRVLNWFENHLVINNSLLSNNFEPVRKHRTGQWDFTNLFIVLSVTFYWQLCRKTSFYHLLLHLNAFFWTWKTFNSAPNTIPSRKILLLPIHFCRKKFKHAPKIIQKSLNIFKMILPSQYSSKIISRTRKPKGGRNGKCARWGY